MSDEFLYRVESHLGFRPPEVVKSEVVKRTAKQIKVSHPGWSYISTVRVSDQRYASTEHEAACLYVDAITKELERLGKETSRKLEQLAAAVKLRDSLKSDP